MCVGRLAAAPTALPGFWSLSEPQLRNRMFDCEDDVCEGGQGNQDGVATCNPTRTGRQFTECKESMFKFNGNCHHCPHPYGLLTWLYLAVTWLTWYSLNSFVCESVETADQFFFFVQFCECIGAFHLGWPPVMRGLFSTFDSLDFDVSSFPCLASPASFVSAFTCKSSALLSLISEVVGQFHVLAG